MAELNIYSRKHHQKIRSIEDLRQWGGPQQAYQGQDGYSAKECAKAWLRNGTAGVPAELGTLFQQHPLTDGLEIASVFPELETRLDRFRGKGRVHDLIAIGDGPAGRTMVAIEAKARETFGPTIGEAYQAGLQRAGSNAPTRIEQLVRAVLGISVETARELRYQLVHAVAGTLLQARAERAKLAVFVVHEFVRDRVVVADNQANLEAFLAILGGAKSTEGRSLHGPYFVPGGAQIPKDMPLLVGKVTVPLP